LSKPMAKQGPTVCDVVVCKLTLILHGRGFAPIENDVKTVAQRLQLNRGFLIEYGNQPVTSLLVRRAIKNRIKRNQRVAGEKHLRDEARRESRPKHRKVNVRCALCIVVIAPR